MGYTVFIPTAGTGSRLGGLTKYLNKSLVSIGNKPTLARIMDMFPEDTEYVIAVGYKGELVKEFVSLTCKDRKITLVDVYPFEGEGSGLGYTMLCCKEYLQRPFVFCSCDTLVVEQIPDLESNWMGWDERDNREQYRTITLNEAKDTVCIINEKGRGLSSQAKPYIGLAGIRDYEQFWHSMEACGDDAFLIGEVAGLQKLVQAGAVKAHKFTWFDTGVTVELETTRHRYYNDKEPNILEKPNETIWFLNDKVIKFSADPTFIRDRVERSKLLKGFVPEVIGFTEHMYEYDYIPGKVMSSCVSLPLFKQLLNTSKAFWKEQVLAGEEKEHFYKSCMKFYRDKTYERVELFFRTFNKEDQATVINQVWYPPVMDMLRQVDWNEISKGLPGQFHGDFHFENILYDAQKGSFEFLDWRQNFGGDSLSVGDIYYDLAKLLHGLIMCHELVVKDEYHINWEGNEITYDFNRKQMLVQCEEYYYKWLVRNGYDAERVKLLTSLIFLNIAGLHHYPYSLVLLALGKEMLYRSLEN